MVLLGTIVNVVAIIIGTLIGTLLGKIPDTVKETVMKGIGLTTIVLGLQMGMQSQNFLLVIISIVVGAVIGEVSNLDQKLNNLGDLLQSRFGNKGKGDISQGFITATLIFCIGAMAVVGSLDSGLRGDHSVLYTKSLLDGFTSIILASTLGIGVAFSTISIFLYQGTIAILASQIDRFVSQDMINLFIQELTATGGVLILAIGLGLAGIAKIKVANILPSLLVCIALVPIFYYFNLL